MREGQDDKKKAIAERIGEAKYGYVMVSGGYGDINVAGLVKVLTALCIRKPDVAWDIASQAFTSMDVGKVRDLLYGNYEVDKGAGQYDAATIMKLGWAEKKGSIVAEVEREWNLKEVAKLNADDPNASKTDEGEDFNKDQVNY